MAAASTTATAIKGAGLDLLFLLSSLFFETNVVSESASVSDNLVVSEDFFDEETVENFCDVLFSDGEEDTDEAEVFNETDVASELVFAATGAFVGACVLSGCCWTGFGSRGGAAGVCGS